MSNYKLIDTKKNLELFDSTLLIDCWNRITGDGQVIVDENYYIVAGHESMLDYVIQTPSAHLSEIRR